MDQTQLQQKIALYYSKLPVEAQQIFSSMSWMETLKTISIKRGLNDSQIETLGLETTLALLGIVHLDDYKKALLENLSLPSTEVDKIVTEIDESILKTIRPQLMDVYEQHVTSLVVEKYGGIDNFGNSFNKLPNEVKEAIGQSDYQSKLYNIATEKKLSVEQMGALEEVTSKVLLGMINPDQYESELTSKLGLDASKTSEVVTSVNESVLKNIREILKSHWNDGKSREVSLEDEVPIPPYAQVKIPEAPKAEIQIPSAIGPELPSRALKAESDIYHSAGIDMLSKEMSEKEDLAKSIIGSKLSQSVVSRPVISDQSLSKVNGAQSQPEQPKTPTPINPAPIVPTAPAHDPYHEAI
jgi:hypothetical protein